MCLERLQNISGKSLAKDLKRNEEFGKEVEVEKAGVIQRDDEGEVEAGGARVKLPTCDDSTHAPRTAPRTVSQGQNSRQRQQPRLPRGAKRALYGTIKRGVIKGRASDRQCQILQIRQQKNL